ncbi:MAG TPA: CocE/NonD family hydrolase C-terminal non-catalytic domain-containing protein, partial [Pseudonocardia sp.]|uniref:CocE/NonD family hydrolase C-terminal non-catalytic domain-containing protein n=1 Tax=Pseudonocardia sp. TaxID=60912 RepID=UPI002C1BCFCC
PYHSHDVLEPLEPGDIYSLEIEIWPTSVLLPQGFRLALTIQGRDYEFPGATPSRLSNFKNDLRGSGPFLHDDPSDRPALTYAGLTTVHTGDDRSSWLRLPVIAPRGAE